MEIKVPCSFSVKMRRNKNLIRNIAKARMFYLFERADSIFPQDYPDNKDLANRYVYLARRYAQRARLKIPPEWKKRICHHCKQFLYPGLNCRVRMQSRKGKASHVSITCLDCNHITRYYINTSNL